MSSEQERFDELTSLESALASLVPRADGLQREEWMYLAGRASRDRHRWLWPTAFSAMTALAATLLVMVLVRPAPPEKGAPAEFIVKAPQVEKKDLPDTPPPAPKEPPRNLPSTDVARDEEAPASSFVSYFSPRPASGTYPYNLDQALAHGVDGWLESVEKDGPAPEPMDPEMNRSSTNHELLNDLLNHLEPTTSNGRPSSKLFHGARS